MQLRHLVKNETLLVKTGNGLFCVKALGLLGQRGAFPKASLLRQKMAPVDDPPHVIGFSPSGARTRLPPEAPRPFRGPRSTLPAQHTGPQCGTYPVLTEQAASHRCCPAPRSASP